MSDDPHFWDAGEKGCGELLLKLKLKLSSLPPGSDFKLIAKDNGAVEDLPAWAKLTGHILVSTNHPEYVFKTK